jgi:RNA polymerase sigma factor (sigma-70 family)
MSQQPEPGSRQPDARQPGGVESGGSLGPSSVDLVRAAQGSSAPALEQLVERHYPAVLAIVRRRLGTELRRFHESGDLVQEALVQAVRSFDRYELEDEAAFLRWIAAVVENRLRDLSRYHRAERREAGGERRASSVDLGESWAGGADAGSGPATRVSEAERQERLAGALERLEPKLRELVRARLDGRSWKDIAEACDYPTEGAARMAYSRAIVGLTRFVDE